MPVYVSTSCLANGRNILDVLEVYAKAGLRRVELGSVHDHIAGLSPANFLQYDFEFLAHHYFPTPREPLVVNLASPTPAILKASQHHIKWAIEFCHSLGVKQFSFHAGFRIDPDIKFRFAKDQPITPYKVAFATFIESVEEVNSYAKQVGIKLAVENNGVSICNLVDEQNRFLLLCEAKEFEYLWDRIPSTNVGILLDLGHLKVAAHQLQYNPYEFVNRVRERVMSIHLHDNNGQADEHGMLDETSWCWLVIKENDLTDVPIVLETFGLSIEQIIQQVRLAERTLERRERK